MRRLDGVLESVGLVWSLAAARAVDSAQKSCVCGHKGQTSETLPFDVETFLLHGHMWLHHWLKARGLDAPRDITLTTMPWEALPGLNDYVAEGFKTGKFDAVAVGEPRPSLMEDKHVARRLVTHNDTTYNNEYCCLTVIKPSTLHNAPP